MSSTDTTKHGEDNNNIDIITEDIERVVISEDKKDTDEECTSCEQNNYVDNVGSDVLQTRTKRGKDDSSDSFECSLCSWGQTTKICISCEQKLEQAKNDDLSQNDTEDSNSVAILDDMSTCASCGKVGKSDDMNTCNKCKAVKYCNAVCKKKHRSKHKKACERRVAELHDEKLFADPPPPEECPICFLPLQCGNQTETFKSCCGKTVCVGCIFAMKMSEGKDLCAFCRTPRATSEEEIKLLEKLMEKRNGGAYNVLAGYYAHGRLGLPRDYQKASGLYHRAGELGCAEGYYNLGICYGHGRGVEVDITKAKHYFELAAMMGDVDARYSVGCIEGNAGNHHRAIKHCILAARSGHEKALEKVKEEYMHACMVGFGFVTKDGYEITLRAYHERQKEMKSDAREKAAALIA